MTAAPATVDFATALLNHLDDQLSSAQRLLDAILRQGQCVRGRDVEGVLACLAEVQSEMERRARLERARSAILHHAANHLQIPVHTVTIDQLVGLIGAPQGELALQRSAELRGLLAEIGREHQINRVLMRQEMAFLDHLTRLIGGDAQPGYRPPTGGEPTPATPSSTLRLLDMSA
jgi:FlgN protein